MFTGIIEIISTVKHMDIQNETIILNIENKFSNNIKIGDSISVNGVCLTVSKLFDNGFQTDIMPVTFRSTNLCKLKIGSKINLERSLCINQRFDGHIVTGHVDDTVTIHDKYKDQNAINVIFKFKNAKLANFLVKNGCVALDGISLTIVDVNFNTFNVAIIPHTLKNTTLASKDIGDLVNIETDILSKYVQTNITQQIKEFFKK